MLKIIVDTNVLVSALIQRSYPYLIIDAMFADPSIKLCVSDALLMEYVDVLNRKRFAKFSNFLANAQLLLADIETRAEKYHPTTQITIIKDDSDNRLLELAEISKARYLITGNTNDFTLNRFKQTEIVTPKIFWERYMER